MARRENDTGGMNLDSLMDTLTNVVGILVVILIFSVLQGADTVKRIKGFVDEISQDQLDQAIAKVQELRSLVDQQRQDVERLDAQAPQVQVDLKRHRETLDQLKKDMEKLATAKVDVAALKKQVEDRRGRVQGLEKDVDAKQKEIQSLKARMAATPARGPDPDAKIVNLPDPREAPKGAKPIVFLCRHGRVAPVDIPALQAKGLEITRGAARAVVRQNRIDCEKLNEILKKRLAGDRYCVLGARAGGDAKPYLAVDLRPEAGDKTESIGKRTSQFNRWIRDIDPSRYFIQFHVFADSFDTYLEARNAAARRGVLAGWVPYAPNGEYWIGFGVDLQMLCLGKEPPKPGPPPPPGEKRPPPPPDVVD